MYVYVLLFLIPSLGLNSSVENLTKASVLAKPTPHARQNMYYILQTIRAVFCPFMFYSSVDCTFLFQELLKKFGRAHIFPPLFY